MNIIKYLPPLSLKNGPWIAGGAALTFYRTGSFETANDLDIYFTSNKQFVLYKDTLLKMGANILKEEKSEYGRVVISFKGYSLDLVCMNCYSSVSECFKSFDFTVVCFATDGKLVLHTIDAIKDLQNKKLRVTSDNIYSKKSGRQIATRIEKYMKKGFNLSSNLRSDMAVRNIRVSEN